MWKWIWEKHLELINHKGQKVLSSYHRKSGIGYPLRHNNRHDELRSDDKYFFEFVGCSLIAFICEYDVLLFLYWVLDKKYMIIRIMTFTRCQTVGGINVKKIIALLLMLSMCLSLCSCGKSENVIAAEEAIKAVGTVTLESKADIEKAEKAVEALTAEEKEKFKMNDELEAIKKRYEELTQEEKVEKVVALIDALGEISLESGEKIDEAKKAFGEIADDYKSKVSNKNVLDDAEATLKELRTAEKERIIAEKTPAFDVEYDKIEGNTWYYHKKLPKYIDIRSYIIPYIGKNGSNTWIVTRYNYTADSWIFWKKLTIMVDGVKYYKNVGSRNTIRDNDTEVWEYYDEALDFNLSMDNADIAMLKAISQSAETIIRFEGDEYSYDLTVTQTDKNIIADVLALYEALTW